MRSSSLLLTALAIAAAGCRTVTDDDGSHPQPQPWSPPAERAAARTWEPWPPPESVGRAPRPSDPNEKMVKMIPRQGGWPIGDMCDVMHKATGRSILFDSTNQTFKQAKIEFFGEHEIPESRLFDWFQSVLSYRKLVLVPVGPSGPKGSQWLILDMADPMLKSRSVWVNEDELADYAERDGLYIATVLRVRDMVETSRARNALSPLSTQVAGIGRVQDVPNARALIVADFAPVVWSMKQALDRLNATALPPPPERPAPPQPPAPPK